MESFEACAAREVLEETGLHIEALTFSHAVNWADIPGVHW